MFKATELQVCVSRLMMPAVCWPRGCGSLSPWSKHCCHLAGQASELCSGNQLSALSHFYALQPAKAIGNLLQVLKKMPEFTTSNISANSWAQSSGWRWVMMWWHLGMPTCNAQRRICLDTDFCPQLYTWRVRLLDECTAVAKYIWPIKPVTASSLHSCSCLQRSECFHQFINAATPPKRCREHCSTEYSSVALTVLGKVSWSNQTFSHTVPHSKEKWTWRYDCRRRNLSKQRSEIVCRLLIQTYAWYVGSLLLRWMAGVPTRNITGQPM